MVTNRAVASVGPGGPASPNKVLVPLVGLGRYIESFQNKKFFNKNTLVNIKNFTSFLGQSFWIKFKSNWIKIPVGYINSDIRIRGQKPPDSNICK